MAERTNTNMIILAREARGLNQNELAERINMSATNLSKIERGDIGISEEIVKAISEITCYPVHFFNQGGSIVPENLNYRKRQNVAQKLITPISAQVNIIRNHVQFLTSSLNSDAPLLPVFEVKENQTPEQIASKLRKRWNVPQGPVQNVTKLLEERNIATINFDFKTERVDSRSILSDDKYPIIYINSLTAGDRQRFSLAYELGQLVMHTFHDVPLHRNILHEANAFAAEFLMPAKEIRMDFEKGVSIALLGELKKKWKVSMIALLYRADDLGIISPNQKRYLLQQFNQLKIRRREPIELDVPREQPKLIKKWIASYRTKTKLGVLEMAALLCLHIDEFMELYY